VTPLGLGLGYALHRDGMQISVTSFVPGYAEKYQKYLEEVLLEMRELLQNHPMAKL
jgi:hypothetical protein